jgi:hypothetical protein
MSLKCENTAPAAGNDHSLDVRVCSRCGGHFCQPCRLAVTGTIAACPTCGNTLEDRCSRNGGCGN